MNVFRRRPLALSTAVDTPVEIDAGLAPLDLRPPAETLSRPPRPRRARRSWSGVQADVRAALPAWVAARAIVLAALALGHFLVSNLHVRDDAVSSQLHQGLFAWDAGFYRGIAAHGYGYGAVPREALRFFPLVPLTARALGVVLAGRSDIALLIVSNASALVLGALLHRLVLVEKGDPVLARRAAWLVALVPPAFVLVLGYSEATFMCLAVAAFLALRTGRWWWAALLGALAGLTRPVGILLTVPAAIEAVRSLQLARRTGGVHAPEWTSRIAAVAGPGCGTAAYLGWVWARFGDALLPLHVQESSVRRGQVVDPVSALLHESRGILHGHHVGSGLHVPWAIGLALLVVVCLRRWPACYGAFAAVMLLAALTSKNLDSLERYALSAFPFALAGATLTANPRVERTTLVLGAAAMEGYALLAFLNAVVP
jgi:hypothetical protein